MHSSPNALVLVSTTMFGTRLSHHDIRACATTTHLYLCLSSALHVFVPNVFGPHVFVNVDNTPALAQLDVFFTHHTYN
eukprot:m.43152 g.43152  ORF g.43152 m.43152 type:complete len:78 (-) comp19309_c0_seq1:51-284(-)